MKSYTLKKVEECIKCGAKLGKNHKHHFKCNECWLNDMSKLCNGTHYKGGTK